MTFNTVTICPHCGQTGVGITDSRVDGHGWRRRRRVCPGCKHRWSTLEIEESQLKELIEARDRLIAIKQWVDRNIPDAVNKRRRK